MKDDNYYFPKIEDFHVGFEFEVLSETHGTWSPPQIMEAVRFTNFFYIEDHLKHDRIRVKKLDRDGIISLKWELEIDGTYVETYKLDEYTLQRYPKTEKISIHQDTNEGNSDLFYGNIKNVSELKKLMHQLEIVPKLLDHDDILNLSWQLKGVESYSRLYNYDDEFQLLHDGKSGNIKIHRIDDCSCLVDDLILNKSDLMRKMIELKIIK